MQLNSKNTFLLAALAIFFVCCKLWYRSAGIEELQLFLFPLNAIVELFTGKSAQFSNELGYYYSSFHFTIDKDCSGFNFFLIASLSIGLLVVRFVSNFSRQWIGLFIVISLAYLLTILANSSRIISLIVVQYQLDLFPDSSFIHQAVGMIIFLFYLLGTYLFLHKQLILNEKLA